MTRRQLFAGALAAFAARLIPAPLARAVEPVLRFKVRYSGGWYVYDPRAIAALAHYIDGPDDPILGDLPKLSEGDQPPLWPGDKGGRLA